MISQICRYRRVRTRIPTVIVIPTYHVPPFPMQPFCPQRKQLLSSLFILSKYLTGMARYDPHAQALEDNTFDWRCIVCHDIPMSPLHIEMQHLGWDLTVYTDLDGTLWVKCDKCHTPFHLKCNILLIDWILGIINSILKHPLDTPEWSVKRYPIFIPHSKVPPLDMTGSKQLTQIPCSSLNEYLDQLVWIFKVPKVSIPILVNSGFDQRILPHITAWVNCSTFLIVFSLFSFDRYTPPHTEMQRRRPPHIVTYGLVC